MGASFVEGSQVNTISLVPAHQEAIPPRGDLSESGKEGTYKYGGTRDELIGMRENKARGRSDAGSRQRENQENGPGLPIWSFRTGIPSFPQSLSNPP